jgi:hypothetical protein
VAIDAAFRDQHDAALAAALKSRENLVALMRIAAAASEDNSKAIDRIKALLGLIERADAIYANLVNLS